MDIFDFHPIIQIPLVVFSGVFAGALLGGIVGFLKAKFGIHEVITSIMFNWISLYFCNFIANSQMFHKPESDGTYSINPSGYTLLMYDWKFSDYGVKFFKQNPFWGDIILKTDFNVNFLVSIFASILMWVFVYRTRKGYELRVTGLNPIAAENAGIN